MIIHIDRVLLTSAESKHFLLMHMHYWANENPRWMRTVPFQHPWSVNCWCGIVGDHVIGLYFFEGRLTGQVFANSLQNVLLQLMEDVPLNVRMNMCVQHDGAPLHYAVFKTSEE